MDVTYPLFMLPGVATNVTMLARVMLLITIARSGDVSAAKVTEPATVSPGLAKCLEGRMRRIVFPRNTNQPELTIQLPMRFNEQ